MSSLRTAERLARDHVRAKAGHVFEGALGTTTA
jgi:hypothetical protein